jgi:hypothetical protein
MNICPRNYRVKTNNPFPVDIDRLEQGCAASSDQIVNNVVTGLLQLSAKSI